MGLNYGFEWDLRRFNGIAWVSKKDLMGKTSEDHGNIMGFHRKTMGFHDGRSWTLVFLLGG